MKSTTAAIMLVALALIAGASAAGEATMTATITLKDTATHDSAVKNIAEVETGFKAWLSGFQIPDVTIQSVSVEKGGGPKELDLKTKFSISSAKDNADAKAMIKKDVGADLEDKRDGFNTEVEKQFGISDAVPTGGMSAYEVTAEPDPDLTGGKATMRTTLTLSSKEAQKFALDNKKDVEAGIKAWMESVQGVTVDDVSISGSGDTKIKTKVEITIADVEDDEAAKEAIDKYLRDNYNDILASLNTAINNEVGSTGSTVTSAGDLEVAAGSSATAIRLTGMAVLGAFLCAGLVI